MGLLETLVLGSYLWATGLAGWLWRQIRRLERNHYAHLDKRLQRVERAVGIV